jgi:hypothetical protein
MGQDFIRRKNDRFVRQRDAYFAEQTASDLFSTMSPEMVVSLCGTAVGPVIVAQELWTPELTAGGPIEFYCGENPAVRLEGAAADHLRSQCAQPHSSMVAQVVEVEQDHGIVFLKIGVSP